MANFTNVDLVGQMTQIAAYGLINSTYQLDEAAVRKYAKLHVGSYLSPPMSALGEIDGKWGWTTAEMRAFVGRIQEIAMEENGGHPMIYGTDAAHGNALMTDTVFFGQQINGAASFNPDLVYEQGRITARDTLASGISWLFDPVLDNMHNPLWPRVYETFGEDPYLISVMGVAITKGIQSYPEAAACMKHWIGYSWNPTGHDKDGVTISDYDMVNSYFPPYKAAVDAGLLTGMENYISVNGVPVVENTKLMTKLLRDDLQFEGLMVTDYAEMTHLTEFHRTARNTDEAMKFSLERTSIDMSMVASDLSSSAASMLTTSSSSLSFTNGTNKLIEENPAIIDRIKESVRRTIKTKLKLGLYDNPLPGEEYLSMVGNDDDVAAALNLARESTVLLQNNDSTLPIAKTSSVFLTGPIAHDVGRQCGGWTLQVQGVSGNDMFSHGVSVKQGLEAVVGSDAFTYFNGLNITGDYTDVDLATAKEYASKAEYTVAVIGEEVYEEKPGDINDLTLPLGQIEYVKELAATGTKVILVLFEGRPRILNDLPENVYAVLNGMLSCELGGKAVAEIIYGDVNPSGRMPITYPKHTGNVMIPYRHRVSTQCASGDYCAPQWDFGHGLSYTNFTYSDMNISTTNVTSSSDSVNVSVTVTNSGSVAGKETVMLFLTQPYRSISVPEVKQLKKFSKISLDAGASQTVEFELTAADWSVYYPQIGQGLKLVAEDADYVIAIKPETDCDVYNETAAANPLCATFTLSTGEYPFGSLVAE
ncbi:Lysosomal beta glucosidase [Phytophthora fragariae]|uniref:beta-glucosidase n=2 Tax=Phytophthora fragariae TaxID=53985 RepID=A0A6A3QE87_9STRA|nr:Lysosomal beta glucosidase [Phytophthora fragariae]KAE8920371.1 Lysosomal beta glucosidase [Phytophthora fragariae]KAE8965914.1 Lysosomal beta glucosidase [Phytophthora fragariae]KAE9074616.1 Lysosomal beta glucosidase [Phytophthora fragariae]KAE9167232.1 Lysosomal beta glucosidase [Phytophthora fragariae]